MQASVLREAEGLDSGELQILLEQSGPSLSGDASVSRAYRSAALRLRDARARARALAAYADSATARVEARAAELSRRGARDTIPVDRTDRPDATTTLIYQGNSDGYESERILLARDVMLTADRTGIERISLDGGYVIFRENLPDGTVRRVQIRSGNDGLRYTWHGDFAGTDREAWLRRMIAYFGRMTTPGQRRW
jgi:hypothetical protein